MEQSIPKRPEDWSFGPLHFFKTRCYGNETFEVSTTAISRRWRRAS